ncbi:MAG: TonB-dependent receptor, partial [Thermosynechococcaceae cyanobacterium]
EDQGNRLFELVGVDTQIALGKTGKLTAEYAHSRNVANTSGDSASGAAYRLNWQSQLTKYLATQAYFRRADAGFANNATLSFVPGQMRYGLSLTGQVAQNTKIVFQADHEDNFGVAPQILSDLDLLLRPGSQPVPGTKQDNSLTSISAGVEQKWGDATLGLNLIHRDRIDRMTSPDTINR